MQRNSDLDPGPQCACCGEYKSNDGYTPFNVKADLIKNNLSKMPITNEQKQLIKRWIVENYTFYVNNAYDYALLVNIGGHNGIKGKLCLSKLRKAFKSYEQEKLQAKDSHIENCVEM